MFSIGFLDARGLNNYLFEFRIGAKGTDIPMFGVWISLHLAIVICS